jgi:hypothetical protein
MPSLYEITCGILGALAVLWIVMALWVYKDSEDRGGPALLWLVLTLIFGFVALLVYIIVRPGDDPKAPRVYTFPPAVAPLPPGPRLTPPVNFTPSNPSFCTRCGKGLTPNAFECPRCGHSV